MEEGTQRRLKELKEAADRLKKVDALIGQVQKKDLNQSQQKFGDETTSITDSSSKHNAHGAVSDKEPNLKSYDDWQHYVKDLEVETYKTDKNGERPVDDRYFRVEELDDDGAEFWIRKKERQTSPSRLRASFSNENLWGDPTRGVKISEAGLHGPLPPANNKIATNSDYQWQRSLRDSSPPRKAQAAAARDFLDKSSRQEVDAPRGRSRSRGKREPSPSATTKPKRSPSPAARRSQHHPPPSSGHHQVRPSSGKRRKSKTPTRGRISASNEASFALNSTTDWTRENSHGVYMAMAGTAAPAPLGKLTSPRTAGEVEWQKTLRYDPSTTPRSRSTTPSRQRRVSRSPGPRARPATAASTGVVGVGRDTSVDRSHRRPTPKKKERPASAKKLKKSSVKVSPSPPQWGSGKRTQVHTSMFSDEDESLYTVSPYLSLLEQLDYAPSSSAPPRSAFWLLKHVSDFYDSFYRDLRLRHSASFPAAVLSSLRRKYGSTDTFYEAAWAVHSSSQQFRYRNREVGIFAAFLEGVKEGYTNRDCHLWTKARHYVLDILGLGKTGKSATASTGDGVILDSLTLRRESWQEVLMQVFWPNNLKRGDYLPCKTCSARLQQYANDRGRLNEAIDTDPQNLCSTGQAIKVLDFLDFVVDENARHAAESRGDYSPQNMYISGSADEGDETTANDLSHTDPIKSALDSLNYLMQVKNEKIATLKSKLKKDMNYVSATNQLTSASPSHLNDDTITATSPLSPGQPDLSVSNSPPPFAGVSRVSEGETSARRGENSTALGGDSDLSRILSQLQQLGVKNVQEMTEAEHRKLLRIIPDMERLQLALSEFNVSISPKPSTSSSPQGSGAANIEALAQYTNLKVTEAETKRALAEGRVSDANDDVRALMKTLEEERRMRHQVEVNMRALEERLSNVESRNGTSQSQQVSRTTTESRTERKQVFEQQTHLSEGKAHGNVIKSMVSSLEPLEVSAQKLAQEIHHLKDQPLKSEEKKNELRELCQRFTRVMQNLADVDEEFWSTMTDTIPEGLQ